MTQMWLFACKSVIFVNRFACCICHCLDFALFLQDDHDGFDPPYGSNPIPIVKFLYAYAETSTLKEILWDTADMSDRRRTQHTDQLGLVKLARATLYRTYGDFDIWHFDTRNGFFFQVGGMRFLKECLQAFPHSPFLSRIPLAADRACRLSPASPVTESLEQAREVWKSINNAGHRQQSQLAASRPISWKENDVIFFVSWRWEGWDISLSESCHDASCVFFFVESPDLLKLA